jgi:nucleoside-diphosphate-sugar epimerase
MPRRRLIDGRGEELSTDRKGCNTELTRRDALTTLVIGSGLIGSQVARILAERGEKPVLMDHAAQPHAIGQIVDLGKVTLIAGDVLRPLSVVDAIRTNGITKIVHTAANPLLTLGAQKEPYAAINLNIMGTTNVLETARVTGLKRVVVSSSSVLNHYLEGGSDNGDFGQEEAFPRPTTFYAATKQAVESIGLNYAKWCGIEFAGLRYGAAFGPWSGSGGGGPSNIVRNAMRDALAGNEASVPPGPMEWVYSKDAARGTVMALDAKDLGNGVFNITMGSVTTPSEMAAAIAAVVPGAKVKFEAPAGTAIALSNRDSCADLSRAKCYLGYEPQFRMRDALHDLGQWMRRYMA